MKITLSIFTKILKITFAPTFMYSSRIGRDTLTYVSFKNLISGGVGASIPVNN